MQVKVGPRDGDGEPTDTVGAAGEVCFDEGRVKLGGIASAKGPGWDAVELAGTISRRATEPQGIGGAKGEPFAIRSGIKTDV